MNVLRCLVPGQAQLGEGPCWDHARARLYWLDIKGRHLFWYEPVGDRQGVIALSVMASVIVPRRDGTLVMIAREGIGIFDSDTGLFERKIALEPDRPGNRPNDGTLGRCGRLWFGTMDDAEQNLSGAVYRLDPDWTCTRVLDGLGIPNSLVSDPTGGLLYVADSRARTLTAYRIDARGRLDQGTLLFDTRQGTGAPDGSAVDVDGYIWNAQWGAGHIARYAPDGTVAAVIAMPVPQPTSCAFGGHDMKTLFITSARIGLDDAALARAPLSGSLFALTCDCPGLVLPEFAG